MKKNVELSLIWNAVSSRINSDKITVLDFINFVEDNDWFGIEPVIEHHDDHDKVFVPAEISEIMINKSIEFLKRISKNESEQIQELGEILGNHYPETKRYFFRYIARKKPSNEHIIHILDFLIFYMQKEIFIYSSSELEVLLLHFSKEKSKSCGYVFADYINWLKDKIKTNYSKITVTNESRAGLNHRKSAYDFDLYLRLFFVLFSDTSIEENNFYQIIAQNQKSAVALLFLSLHMICALRDGDIKNLPHPKLMNGPKTVLEQIANNEFSDTDALIAVEKILLEIETLQPSPTKTAHHKNMPYIKLFIPESIKVHFGILFAAAEAHNIISGNKKGYLFPITSYENFQEYLGDDVAEIFWDEDYSTRRMNKTYLQIIQNYIDYDLAGNAITHEQPIGYMFASFARSHKMSYAEFSSMTAVYLQDQRASGYTMEYIVRQLQERGVCSFAVSQLLLMCFRDDFQLLTMSEQTAVIKEIGLTPYEIENAVRLYETGNDNALKLIDNLLISQREINREIVSNALISIALGNAAAKNRNVMCILHSLGQKCPYTDSHNCIGCEYEILTKGAIYKLSLEYQRNKKLMKETKSVLMKNKYKEILTRSIMPAINEVLTYIYNCGGKEKIMQLERIIREVTDNE